MNSRVGGVAAACGLLLFALLAPVGGLGASSIHGASTARTVALALFALAGLAAVRRVRDRAGIQLLKPAILGLLVLGAIGVAVSAADAGSFGEFVSMSKSAAGQPILYAAVLFIFVRVQSEDSRNTERLLFVWALAIIAEALVVLWQLGSGRAYDPLRNITRAGGTVGADFAGAIAVISLYSLAGFLVASRRRLSRIVASVGIVASIVILVAVVSRGPLVAAGLGLVYLVLSGRHAHVNWRRSLLPMLALCLMIGVAVFVGRGLWQTRLASVNTRHFDRPATWVSGLRIGSDHLMTGVGPGRAAFAVTHNPRYQNTPFGRTHINPHNSWIFAFAECGIVYALTLLLVTIALIRAACVAPPVSRVLRYERAALVAVFPLFFINNLFTHPEIMIFVLLCVATLSQAKRSIPVTIKNEADSPSCPPPTSVGASDAAQARSSPDPALAAPARPIRENYGELAKWITCLAAILAVAVIAVFAVVHLTKSGSAPTANEASQAKAAASVLAQELSLYVARLEQLDHNLWRVHMSGTKNARHMTCFIIDTTRLSTNRKGLRAGVTPASCVYPPVH